MKEPILDADYTTIRPGRGGRVEETRKRRRQFWAATIQGLALAAGLMAITAGVTAMLMQEMEKLKAERDSARHNLRTVQKMVKEYQEEIIPGVRERAEKAEEYVAELMGISPQERITTCFGHPLDRVIDLVKADREGRCVVLPCKVGDELFYSDGEWIGKETVEKIVIDIETDGGIYAPRDIGYSVYKSVEEAEAALKGDQDG